MAALLIIISEAVKTYGPVPQNNGHLHYENKHDITECNSFSFRQTVATESKTVWCNVKSGLQIQPNYAELCNISQNFVMQNSTGLRKLWITATSLLHAV